MIKDQYDVVIRNNGSVELDMVHISYGNFISAGGILPPTISSTHSRADYEIPIPEEATAKWVRVRDGKKFEKVLIIKSALPKGQFKGNLIFLFDNDDVELKLQTWKEEEEELMKIFNS